MILRNGPIISRYLFVLIPFSLCFSERGSAVLTLLYVLSVLMQGQLLVRIQSAFRQKWIYPFILLYGIHVLALLWTEDLTTGFFMLEKKAALLFLPIAICMDRQVEKSSLHLSMIGLIAGCISAFWVCLINAFYQYGIYQDPIVFYYHSFGWPLGQFNAVYFSMYIFASLVFLDYLITRVRHKFFLSRRVRWFALLSLSVAMLLLSSKLFIVLTVGYLLIVWHRARSVEIPASGFQTGLKISIAILLIGVFSMSFSRGRFTDLLDSEFEVLQLEKFHWDTPFNGLTLRLVLLKFGWEIMNRPGVVLCGVGPGDLQNEINLLIRKYNLYHGNPSLGDKGYLDYDVHNQFLDIWLQTGIGGLILWVLILVQAWNMAFERGRGDPVIYLLFAVTIYSFLEGVLERQRGIVFLTYFISIFHLIRDDTT